MRFDFGWSKQFMRQRRMANSQAAHDGKEKIHPFKTTEAVDLSYALT
jgi:hypothetical protein